MNKKQMEDAALCEKMDNKGENLECVRNTLIIINNKVYERGGNIIDYEREILKALLGVNWEERHIIGKQFIEEVS